MYFGDPDFRTVTHALLNKDRELGRGGLVKSQEDFEREVKKLGMIHHLNLVALERNILFIIGLKKQKTTEEGNEKGRRQRVLHSTKIVRIKPTTHSSLPLFNCIFKWVDHPLPGFHH
ncbi:hypothetical protein L1887_35033 [Cichorium endivia]|nr:hypothetical protein L1887_35033 [Cichorium endivia]